MHALQDPLRMNSVSASRETPALPPLPDPHGLTQPGPVTTVEERGDGIEAAHGDARLRLRFLDDGVLEVRLAPSGAFSDGFSYALDPDAEWTGPADLTTEIGDATVTLRTAAMTVRLDRASGRLGAYTPDGRPIQEDEAGAAWQPGENGQAGAAERVALSKRLRPGERLFGLGDKTARLDRRGRRFEHWNTDAFKFGRGTDPIYKTIPFVLGLADSVSRPAGGERIAEPIAYGLFVDTPARSAFDLGAESGGRLRVEAEADELVYYLLHAPTPLGVVRLFARLTGRTPMLPRWALGYHQCRYSYATEAEVREVAAGFRERGIPCDTLYFDIHYMDGFRVFTWDREAFPDPAGLLADLRREGFTGVVIVDPGVKADDPDYPVAQDGAEHDVFVKYPDGTPFRGEVWPGICYFPDFTREDVRRWWGDWHRGLLDDGVAGVWCDMNEPAVFTLPGSEEEAGTMPDEVRHGCDGRSADHRGAHNLYGMQMLRATYEGLRRLRPERRPFTITRAAYAGTQRYGTAWTGDNSATWDHLRLAIQQCLSLGVSGMPFAGADVGGFCETPSGELLARWTQLGAVTPLFRNHSAIDTPRQEPWLFGEDVERVCRGAIELRYRLLPYLYTVLHQAATDGTPILRPLALAHPADETIRATSPLGFYVGDSLLAQPVVEEGQAEREVYLPPSPGGWFDFHTGERFEGRSTIWTGTPLDRLPLYVKAGTVLPLGPVVPSTAALVDQPLTLRVYPAEGDFSSVLYEDAGDGWEHEAGGFYRCTLRGQTDAERVTVTPEVQGSYRPAWRRWNVEVFGLPAKPRRVAVEGEEVGFSFSGGVLRFEAPVSAAFEVVLRAGGS